MDSSPDFAADSSMTKGIQLGLSRIVTLLGHLGNPHLAVPIVHVAGTNGKGSVCAYIDSILRASGLRVGRFTSPHLVEVRDCISVQGQTIAKDDYAIAKEASEVANKLHAVGASSFELLTATAFQAFKIASPPLDVAVVEVGMGGATDATNVCPQPLVTAITAIDLDHQALLGSTIGEIASVKAGIIKPGVACVLSPQESHEVAPVVADIAKAQKSPLFQVEPGQHSVRSGKATFTFAGATFSAKLPLAGDYQLANAATAVKAVEILRERHTESIGRTLSTSSVIAGLESARWPGRLDWIQLSGRDILLDGAHNPSSVKALRDYLDHLPSEPTTFILALSSPREPGALLEPLLNGFASISKVIAVDFSPPDGMPWVKPISPADLASAANAMHIPASTASSLEAAIDSLPDTGRVVICGSLYLVSDTYRIIGKI
jgi:folylpolyglutamate synthase